MTPELKNRYLSPTIPPLYKHQEQTVALLRKEPAVFDMSDPGTSKTRSTLTAFWERRLAGAGRMVVTAPKSILKAVWAAEIDKFFPGMTYMIAPAERREKAFASNVDVIITNYDATTWMQKHWNTVRKHLGDDPTFVADESTCFKNGQAARSKAARLVSKDFTFRELLTGSPNPNTILELWHQTFLLDRGARLGDSFWRFRSVVCEPKQTGPRADMITWVDKPDIEMAVYDLIRDITIRHKFEDCVQIPPNVQRVIEFELPKKLREAYEAMRDEARIALTNGEVVTSVHAASLRAKLLQIAAGAVYSGPGKYVVLDNSRTELIMDLVEARKHTLVAFLWKHQRDLLVAEAIKRGLTYAIIDGDTKDADRHKAAVDFQDGKLRVLFVHPQSAGHGLTLTRGTSAIWASPSDNAEWIKQFFHRIYRNSQTEPTETIHIIAPDTADEKARANSGRKLTAMALLLDLVAI